MKKIFLLLTLSVLSVCAFAQGGMWLPVLASERIKDMKSKGFRLSADDIYNVNKACMKDAVMLFGGGCTGEIVSDKGLVLTNHHCGKSYIQSHSSLDNDYLTNGYWAKSMDEELSCPGLDVRILHCMELISADMGDMARPEDRERVISQYKKKYGDGYECSVESFYGGNVFYMFVYQVFTDIRLVGAPPMAIGNFGGDTDNWMWPRHGGDFSVFRIYADKNNKPAPYSPSNRPYVPKSHFKISLKGVREGDFTMVFGFPGTTEEYLPSCAVQQYITDNYPARVYVRQNIMEAMQEAMNRDRAVRISYTSRLAGVENAKKKWEGAILGLRRYDAVGRKKTFEQDFAKAMKTDEQRREYGQIISDYEKVFSPEANRAVRADAYFMEAIYSLTQCKLAEAMYKVLNIDVENVEESDLSVLDGVQGKMRTLYGRDSICEREIMRRTYRIYCDSCPDFMPDGYADYCAQHGISCPQDFVDMYYRESVMADSVRAMAFLKRYRSAMELSQDERAVKLGALRDSLIGDPGIYLYYNFVRMYITRIAGTMREYAQRRDNLDKLYQKALMELMPDRIKFPDANLTLRFTYGKVDGFCPRDGVYYRHFTTLEGVMEKDNPEIYDYHVPERLKELFRKKDYGRYADKADGRIHVCFAASNHTTGGNSGSPVINGNGELIGINFDRCWEGTMSDIMYSPEICRNISVDIRYVLFLIDKLGNAGRLIDEMDIVE